MAVTIEQVKHWITMDGIGHVVVSGKSGWLRTGCDTLSTYSAESLEQNTPKRICRRCREFLKRASLKEGAA